jgi:hypothetical protein
MLCHSKPSPFRKAEFLVLTDSFASLNFLELTIFFLLGGFADFFGTSRLLLWGILTEPLSQVPGSD